MKMMQGKRCERIYVSTYKHRISNENYNDNLIENLYQKVVHDRLQRLG